MGDAELKTRRRKLYENALRNAEVAAYIIERGWPIDKDEQAKIAVEVRENIEKYRSSLDNMLEGMRIPEEKIPRPKKQKALINWGSTKQVGWLIYNHLGAKVRHRTDTGAPSLDAVALKQMAESEPNIQARECAKALFKWKKWQKLESSYINNLEHLDVVHPEILVTGQISGRHSIKEPALQITHQTIKPMFVAHNGGCLIGCDYAGAELRSGAQETGDPNMLAAFAPGGGGDLHSATAEIATGVPRTHPDFLGGDGKPNLRKSYKPLSLGFMYSARDLGATATGLLPQLQKAFPWLNLKQMTQIVHKLADARPGVLAWKDRVDDQCKRLGYVAEVLSGRRRYFPGKYKLQEALNFPNQARIAFMVDRAMQGIYYEIRERELEEICGLLMNRHDEIMMDSTDLWVVFDLLWRHMRQTHTVNGHEMLFEIEFTVWKNWGRDGVVVEPTEDGQFKCVGRAQKIIVPTLKEAAQWAESCFK